MCGASVVPQRVNQLPAMLVVILEQQLKSWLTNFQSLAVVDICGVKQWVENLVVSLFPSDFVTLSFK